MKAADVHRIAVIGAGLMGHGIALEFAIAGYDVRLCDQNEDLLGSARDRIAASWALLESHGLVKQETGQEAISNIGLDADLQATAEGADVVIEAVTEDLEIK